MRRPWVPHPCGFQGAGFDLAFLSEPDPAIRNPLSHNDLYLLLDNSQKCAIIYDVSSRRRRESPNCLRYPPAPATLPPLLQRVRTRFIRWNSPSLCFHALTHSFATRKTPSPILSMPSALFAKNTRGGGHIRQAPKFYNSLPRTSTPTRHAGALASPILSCISAHFPSHRGVGVRAHFQPQVQLRILASAPASRIEPRISYPLFHGPLSTTHYPPLTSPCATLPT